MRDNGENSMNLREIMPFQARMGKPAARGGLTCPGPAVIVVATFS